MKAKVCSLSIAAAVALSSSPAALANAACSRFIPGHYFAVTDDNTRGQDGLNSLRSNLSKDVRNFKGVEYGMNWGMIERSKGVYDFSRLDAALAQVTAKGKYLLLQFQERTFHSGCSSSFVPSYIAKEKNANNANGCYAKVWESATADNMIRVLQQVALRYRGNPNFLGIALPETSILPTSFVTNRDLALSHYEQLKRTAQAVKSVAPPLIMHQNLNWPRGNNVSHFYKIADSLVGTGGGGSVGWPDTRTAYQNSYSWYQVGRDYRYKLAVMADVQTTFIGSTLAEHDKIYKMLNDDIKAHMIVWATWHKNLGVKYFTNVIIPTVNKYNGAVSNKACPF